MNWPKSIYDPTVILGALTVYLYILAVCFVDGFVQTFGADASWFSPSLFQIIAISWHGVLIGAAIVAGHAWITHFAKEDRIKKTFSVVYDVLIIAVFTITYKIQASSHLPGTPRLVRIVIFLPFLLGTFTTDVLVPLTLVLFIWVRHSWLKKPFPEISNSSTNFLTALVTSAFAIYVVISVPFMCTYMGQTYAMIYFDAQTHRIDQNVSNKHLVSHILFTDGSHSVLFEQGDTTGFVFQGDGESILLMSAPAINNSKPLSSVARTAFSATAP